MRILYVSPLSISVELDNHDVYFAPSSFDVSINGEVILNDVTTNVFTVYGLEEGHHYRLEAMGDVVEFDTPTVTEKIILEPGCNLQEEINKAKRGSLLFLKEGEYNIVSLMLKSHLTIYLDKGAVIKASTNPDEYPEIQPYFINERGEQEVFGTWEGEAMTMKRSIIMGHHAHDVAIVGEGTIDGQAQDSTWWIDYKKKTPRPHLVYFCHCRDITMVGVSVMNSPQWTIHPFFSKNCYFYDLKISNPKISPNTDGLDPQACENVEIIGVHFSVGDDCIAIKSGKINMATTYKKACDKLLIRNCWMQYGHGGVVLGSEMAGGITNLKVERCLFDSTDRGLRIKTRRGRGKLAVIDNVTFSDIVMKGVLTPLVMNMFYFCDPDGKTEYVWSKEKLPVDDRTPYLGKFTFERIEASGIEYAAGYFYGLPEMKIEEINIIDSSFSFKEECGEGTPAMMSFAEVCSKKGFICKNVRKVNISGVNVYGAEGPLIEKEGVEEVNINE